MSGIHSRAMLKEQNSSAGGELNEMFEKDLPPGEQLEGLTTINPRKACG